MGILVKGMEMPETCNKCFFDHRKCEAHQRQVERIANSETEQIFDVFGEMRLEDCPLVEVKPHGRLVDGDKLLADHNPNENWDYMVLECIIRNAPTVLEATE